MDIIVVGGKVYGVVITQDDAGAEIGLWCGDEQVACISIDDGFIDVSLRKESQYEQPGLHARQQ